MGDETTMEATKCCTKCGRELPATAEWFRLRTDRASQLRSHCRTCEMNYRRSSDVRAKMRAYQKTPESKEYQKAYRCRPEVIAKEKLRNLGRKERKRAYMKSYHQRENVKTRRQSYMKKYYKTPNAKEKNKARGIVRRQSSEGRLMGRIYAHRYHARRRALPSNFTKEDWRRALDYFGCRCAVCNRPIGLWHTLSQDHWTPVSKGGAYTPDNIIPLCHGEDGCNNSKGNKDAHEWLMERYSARQTAQIEKRITQYFEWVQQRKCAYHEIGS